MKDAIPNGIFVLLKDVVGYGFHAVVFVFWRVVLMRRRKSDKIIPILRRGGIAGKYATIGGIISNKETTEIIG